MLYSVVRLDVEQIRKRLKCTARRQNWNVVRDMAQLRQALKLSHPIGSKNVKANSGATLTFSQLFVRLNHVECQMCLWIIIERFYRDNLSSKTAWNWSDISCTQPPSKVNQNRFQFVCVQRNSFPSRSSTNVSCFVAEKNQQSKQINPEFLINGFVTFIGEFLIQTKSKVLLHLLFDVLFCFPWERFAFVCSKSCAQLR